jgi:hypothetical protein
MVVAEWDITVTMLDGSDLHGMMPTLFAENPSAAEVAFHGDPVNARKDVDRLNRCLFQAEAVDGEEAIQICCEHRCPADERAEDILRQRSGSRGVRFGFTAGSNSVRFWVSASSEEGQAGDFIRPGYGFMF